MRRWIPLLLAASVVADEDGTLFRDEASTFELRLPPTGWERRADDPAHIKLHLQASSPLGDPEATAEVQVIVWPLGTTEMRRTLQDLMGEWKKIYEVGSGEVRERAEGEGTLGGVACRTATVLGATEDAPVRVAWTLAREGRNALIFYERRTRSLAGDEGIAKAILAMRASFRALPGEAAPPPPEPPPIDPEQLKEKKFGVESHRFECVKPEGLVESICEKRDGLLLQFDGEREQSRLRLRVYAAADAERRWTLDQYLASIERAYETDYEDRKEPALDLKAKVPLAKQAVRITLVGKAAVVHRITWLLADCRNGVQYRLQVFQTGAADFDAAIARFLGGFRPLPKRG